MEENKSKKIVEVLTQAASVTPEGVKQREILQNKRRVKMIGFMQLMYASLVLVLIIMAVFATTLVTIVSVEAQAKAAPEKLKEKSVMEVILSFMWLVLIGCAVETGFQIWSSMRLLKATDMSFSTTQRLACIHSWKMVTLVFTIVDAFALLTAFQSVFPSIVFVIVRCVFWWEVETFRTNLEKKLINNTPAPSDFQVVVLKDTYKPQ